jgi:hypothetical protein
MFSISNLPRRLRRRTWLALAVTILVLLSAMLSPQRGSAQDMIQQAEAQATSQPLIHVPYFSDSANPGQGAVFWFGKVEHTTNHANVRIAYDNDALVVVLHIFDRRVSYEAKTNAESDLTQWDSVSLYLDPLGDLAAPLSINAYRFDAQISAWEPRTDFERQYRWDGATWTATSVAFETEAGFRANPNDDSDDRGWLMSFRVPFTTLSLPSTPIQGSVFRMALSLHDRDELDQAVLPDQNWPRNVALDLPATWGRISFGIPTYNAPTVVDPQKVSLRHGVAGVVAPDAAVGGHSTCGTQYDPNFFDGWGEANYAGFAQFNIQNQWAVLLQVLCNVPSRCSACYRKHCIGELDSLPVWQCRLFQYGFQAVFYAGCACRRGLE